MRVLKLFTLLALLAALWVIANKPVSATDCYQEFTWCIGAAQGARDTCYDNCGGIIACENVCNMKYDEAIAACEIDFENCQNP